MLEGAHCWEESDRAGTRAMTDFRRALRYHQATHGFVCDDCGPASGPFLPLAAREFLNDAFRRKPSDLVDPFPTEAAVLESFHRDLISRHLERVLRSSRVMKDIARGTSA